MSEVTKLQDCTWRAIEAVNRIVECDDTFEERHLAIDHVRKHLDERARQCKPKDDLGIADLLGDFTQ